MRNFIVAAALAGSSFAGPLDNWTTTSDSNTPILRDIAFAGGKFVAVGDGFAVSADGKNWSYKPSIPGVASVMSVTYGNGRFVGVGANSALVSEDGTNWISRSISTVVGFGTVSFGNGKFVAVGASGIVAVSSDGEFWTTAKLDLGDLLNGTFGGGMFFCSSSTTSKEQVSTNGISWQQLDTPPLGDIVTLNGALYAALAQRTSIDGTNWTSTGNSLSFNLRGMSSMPGMLLGVDGFGLVWNSIDGTNWISRNTGITSGNLVSIAFGNGVVVAVGNTLTSKGLITTSGDVPPSSDVSLSLAFYPGVAVSGAVGRTYRIDAATSPDSASWKPVGQITLTKSPQNWFDEISPSEPKLFYRAVLLPLP